MRSKILIYCFILVTLFEIFPAEGQKRVSVGFYNTENFFDTIPSLFYDDSDYTPGGRLKWNSDKYTAKIINICRVVDDMSLDVIALGEVETEGVVRDIVSNLTTDYNYIHKLSGDSRGMDIAVLYKGDKFVPVAVTQIDSGISRKFLYVRGELYGKRIDLIFCHLPSRLNKKNVRKRSLDALFAVADSLHRYDADALPVILGDFNASPDENILRRHIKRYVRADSSHSLYSPLAQAYIQGKGTYAYSGKWQLLDNIFVSRRSTVGEIKVSDAGIFIRDYMLASRGSRRGYPLRTFTANSYTAGYSDHLPVYVILEISAN